MGFMNAAFGLRFAPDFLAGAAFLGAAFFAEDVFDPVFFAAGFLLADFLAARFLAEVFFAAFLAVAIVLLPMSRCGDTTSNTLKQTLASRHILLHRGKLYRIPRGRE